MTFKIHLWIMIPVLVILTSLFFLVPHMKYTIESWVIGNGIVALGVGLIYLGEFVFKFMVKKTE